MTGDDGTVRVYTVPDISCDHCKRAIEGEVSKVAGVSSLVVTVESRQVRVTGSADDTAIRAAIDDPQVMTAISNSVTSASPGTDVTT